MWCTPLSGQLGEDNGLAVVARSNDRARTCEVCGRHGHPWYLSLRLPAFPTILHADAGCSRDHAAAWLPTNWHEVATGFINRAAYLKEDREPTLWHEHVLQRQERYARRAHWLADHGRQERHLALATWQDNDAITTADMATVVAAVLDAPSSAH